MAKRKRCLVIDDDINVRNVLDVKLRTREMYDVDLAADRTPLLRLWVFAIRNPHPIEGAQFSLFMFTTTT